jgi:TolB-like protein
VDHGIFISYSREDEKQALHLLNVLRREGFQVWIDQEAIAGASIWSDEIVQNIKTSEIFIALLSPSSVASANVAKEIALAAEHGKIILPIEIGDVVLPGRLEYALAGIQRTNFHDEDAILRAVRSQVARLSGLAAPVEPVGWRSKRTRTRISFAFGILILIATGFFAFSRRSPEATMGNNTVAVLPFSTLNIDRDSTRNLDMFSEEIITRLSRDSNLQTTGASISASYRDSRLNAMAIANDLQKRYIVQGLVRKQADVDYISVRICDAKSGGEVWEKSYSGNNRVLFSIRERMCNDIVGFLREATNKERDIHLAEQNLTQHPNDGAAYARLAHEISGTDKNRALQLWQEAIKRDPNNLAYYLSAGICAERTGEGGQDFGNHAVPIALTQLNAHPDSLSLIINYCIALDIAGQSLRSGAIYDSLLERNPNDVRLNFNAACCYSRQGKTERALDLLEKLLVIAPGKRGEVQYDPDFDNIRSNPRYLNLIYGYD